MSCSTPFTASCSDLLKATKCVPRTITSLEIYDRAELVEILNVLLTVTEKATSPVRVSRTTCTSTYITYWVMCFITRSTYHTICIHITLEGIVIIIILWWPVAWCLRQSLSWFNSDEGFVPIDLRYLYRNPQICCFCSQVFIQQDRTLHMSIH